MADAMRVSLAPKVYLDPPVKYLLGGPDKNVTQKPYQTQKGATWEGVGRVWGLGHLIAVEILVPLVKNPPRC